MAAPKRVENKAQLLEAMRTGRADFEALLAQLSAEEMLAPQLDNQWSVKDLLAHIGWWANHAANIIEPLLRGQQPAPEHDIRLDTDEQVDHVNANVFAQHQNMALVDAQSMERDAYHRLYALTEQASQEDLFDPARFEYLRGRPLYSLIGGNSFWHHDEHTPALGQFINSLKGT